MNGARVLAAVFVCAWFASACTTTRGNAAVRTTTVARVPSQDPEQDKADTDRAQRRTVDRISQYEPTFFAIGANERINAKFQFSLRYQLYEGGTEWLEGFHVAYTQTSIWDLESASKPFFDSSYRPALFWRRDVIDALSSDDLELGIEAGFEHESNGKAGDESRSINIAYARPSVRARVDDDVWLVCEPKVWGYLEKSENRDIAEFRGYGEFRVGGYCEDGLGAFVNFRVGDDLDRGSLDVQVSYPLAQLLSGDVSGFLFLQYFNGWGETILNYDQKSPAQIRLGVALVRW